MSWHVDQPAIDRYRARQSDRVAAASLEAHLTGCEQCRGMLGTDRDWLEQSWAGVADRVMPGRRSLIERTLSGIGVPASIARLVALSPALRLSFVLAVALVLAFSVVASGASPEEGRFSFFLTIAPLVPVAGVAVAYSRQLDPLQELTLASPIDSFRLLLVRTATVLGVGVGLGLLAWPLVQAPSSIGVAAWLLPGLALTATTLALASRWEVSVAAIAVASCWLLLALGASQGGFDLYNRAAESIAATLTVIAFTMVFLFRNHYDRRGGLA